MSDAIHVLHIVLGFIPHLDVESVINGIVAHSDIHYFWFELLGFTFDMLRTVLMKRLTGFSL
jgi:hypothetical protein